MPQEACQIVAIVGKTQFCYSTSPCSPSSDSPQIAGLGDGLIGTCLTWLDCLQLLIVAGTRVCREAAFNWKLLQESLDYNLIVFSPYRDLAAFLADPNLTGLADFAWWDIFLFYPTLSYTWAQFLCAGLQPSSWVFSCMSSLKWAHIETLIQYSVCRAALNDSLRTDAFVLYPPFVIAIAALNVVSCSLLRPFLKISMADHLQSNPSSFDWAPPRPWRIRFLSMVW